MSNWEEKAEKLLRRMEAEALISENGRSEIRTLYVELDKSDSTTKFLYKFWANNSRATFSLGYGTREVALQRIRAHEKHKLTQIN
jgi:hypothetical protein